MDAQKSFAKMRLNAELPLAANPKSRLYDPTLVEAIQQNGRDVLREVLAEYEADTDNLSRLLGEKDMTITLTPAGRLVADLVEKTYGAGTPLSSLGLSIRDMADLGLIEPLPLPVTAEPILTTST
jgi:hypothetical protein